MVVVYITVNFIDLELYVFTMYVESRSERGRLFCDKIVVINILLMYIL